MSFLQNFVGAFSSPAKPLPATKRNVADMSHIRSNEKRKRGACDPAAYQKAVYAGAGTVTMTEDEVDEEYEAVASYQTHRIPARADAEDQDQDQKLSTHPHAIQKSVRMLSGSLSTALETEKPYPDSDTVTAAIKSNKKLDEVEKLLADGSGRQSKESKELLNNIAQTRKRNNEIISKAVVEASTLSPTGTPVRGTGKAGAMGMVERVASTSTDIEREDESESDEDVGADDDFYDEIELRSDGRHLPLPSTTRSGRPVITSSNKVLVDHLKHVPISKQPRSQPDTAKHRLNDQSSPKPTTTTPTIANSIPTTALPKDISILPDWSTMPPSLKWSSNPNLRARELASSAPLIRTELSSEPEYAFRDAEIRDGLWSLTNNVENFAKEFFPHGAHESFTTTAKNGDTLVKKAFFKSLTAQTAKVISCVASGGPSGVYGWHDLFVDGEKLQALVCGIMGNVLTEQVLQHRFFRGGEEGIRAVMAVERDERDADGFDRNARYASTIRAHLPAPTSLPENFNAHVNTIVAALWTHLSPLLSLVHPPPSSTSSSSQTAPTLAQVFPSLHTLTVNAALLSLHMHLDPHTAYHHAPLFKEDNYTSSAMECFNEESMKQRNMDNTFEEVGPEEQERRAKLSEAEKKRAGGDTALTQIVCFEGVTAYRRGGWEDGKSSIDKPIFEKSEYEDTGVRARVLTHGLAYCRWGRARSMKNAGSLDEETGKRIHGDVWREGGFRNFTDVEGVVDWLGKERNDRDDAKKAALDEMNKAAEKVIQEAEKARKKNKGQKRTPGLPAMVEDSDPDR